MKQKSFRFCMLVGAVALLSVAIFYFSTYMVTVRVALNNNDLEPFVDHSVRALWLSFASQALLIGLLYLLVAYRPHTVSREVIVLLGLGQMVEVVLLLVLAGSKVTASLLAVASVFLMVGAMLWPKRVVRAPEADTALSNLNRRCFDAQRVVTARRRRFSAAPAS